MTKILYCNVPIVDEFEFPLGNVYAAIYEAVITTQKSIKGNMDTGECDVEELYSGIAFRCQYWQSKEHKDRGVMSRVLKRVDVDGKLTDLFLADLDDNGVVDAVNGLGLAEDNALKAGAADLQGRFG
jgi:hypothetical protein